MCTLSVSNVIYHKFSHGAAFYTLNGKNVNVMLESLFIILSVWVVISNIASFYYNEVMVLLPKKESGL